MPELQQLFGEVAGAERFGSDQRTLIAGGRLARRRCQSSTAPRTINASRKGTRMGASVAARERAAEAVSSRNERGGPNRTTFATGRTPARTRWTVDDTPAPVHLVRAGVRP